MELLQQSCQVVRKKRGPPPGAMKQLSTRLAALQMHSNQRRKQLALAAAAVPPELLPCRSLACRALLAQYHGCVGEFEKLLGWPMLVRPACFRVFPSDLVAQEYDAAASN
jgi:hypothetical protein